jgi:hypothetical protein
MDSLRRHDPDQVPRVCGVLRTLSAVAALPCPTLLLAGLLAGPAILHPARTNGVEHLVHP